MLKKENGQKVFDINYIVHFRDGIQLRVAKGNCLKDCYFSNKGLIFKCKLSGYKDDVKKYCFTAIGLCFKGTKL